MKVFVTGATGVIGSRVVPKLVAAGHDVTAVARSDEKARGLEAAGAHAARVSLFDPAELSGVIAGHDAVVNLATHIPKTSRAALPGAWKENDRLRSEGSRNLVDAALATGATRYVQESITFIYADAGDRWIDESSDVTVASFVQSVLDAEANARRITDNGGQGVVLRFAMFYAADGHHTEDLFHWARRGFSLEAGELSAYKTMVHADDAAAAVVAAMDAPAGTYNVAEDDPLTRGDHLALVAELVGRKALRRTLDKVSGLGGSKVDLLKRSQRVSNRRFRETTGWAPRYPSVREGYPETYRALEASHA